MKIITSEVRPPIPTKEFDWCAYREDDVEKSYLYGWGTTEAEARADLERLLQEEAEYLEEQAERAREQRT